MKTIANLLVSLILISLFISKANAQTDTTYWWNDDVFYEAFVRSYYDSSGDGIGDLQGLTSKLNYLQSLGVDAIWLMPVCPSPSYHGYDITDYEAINPQYGSIQDYTNFVTACHSRGMKVIFDAVMNHTSSQHAWYMQSEANDSAYRDFYIWETDDPNYNGPWGEQVWYKQSHDNYYYGVYSNVMPDLNYRTPQVKDTMFDMASFWLDSMHVDGFRCDGAPYIVEDGQWMENTPETLQFWADFHTLYRNANPNAMAVGEVWLPDDTILEYTGNGELDFCFEFNLAGSIISAINNTDAPSLASEFQYIYNEFPFAQYGTFLSNADQSRSFDQLGDNLSNAKVAAAIYMSLPGIPFIYYGEEIGMVGSANNPVERSPMQWTGGANAGFTTGTPWEAINSNYTTYNVATESVDTNSLLNWYKKLTAVRHANPVLCRGTYYNIRNISDNSIYSFVRSYNGTNALVVINISGSTFTDQNFDLAGAGVADGLKTVTELLSDTSFMDSVSGQRLNGINVPPYSSAIYLLTDSVLSTGIAGSEGSGKSNVSLNVFSNPNNGRMLVEVQQPAETAISLTVINTIGQIVYQDNILNVTSPYQQWIDLSAQTDGMYFVYLRSKEGTAVQKVIIAR